MDLNQYTGMQLKSFLELTKGEGLAMPNLTSRFASLYALMADYKQPFIDLLTAANTVNLTLETINGTADYDWDVNTAFGIGDKLRYQNQIYVVTVDVPNNIATFPIDKVELKTLFGIDASNLRTWHPGFSYDLLELITYNGQVYQTTSATSTTTFDIDIFRLVKVDPTLYTYSITFTPVANMLPSIWVNQPTNQVANLVGSTIQVQKPILTSESFDIYLKLNHYVVRSLESLAQIFNTEVTELTNSPFFGLIEAAYNTQTSVLGLNTNRTGQNYNRFISVCNFTKGYIESANSVIDTASSCSFGSLKDPAHQVTGGLSAIAGNNQSAMQTLGVAFAKLGTNITSQYLTFGPVDLIDYLSASNSLYVGNISSKLLIDNPILDDAILKTLGDQRLDLSDVMAVCDFLQIESRANVTRFSDLFDLSKLMSRDSYAILQLNLNKINPQASDVLQSLLANCFGVVDSTFSIKDLGKIMINIKTIDYDRYPELAQLKNKELINSADYNLILSKIGSGQGLNGQLTFEDMLGSTNYIETLDGLIKCLTALNVSSKASLVDLGTKFSAFTLTVPGLSALSITDLFLALDGFYTDIHNIVLSLISALATANLTNYLKPYNRLLETYYASIRNQNLSNLSGSVAGSPTLTSLEVLDFTGDIRSALKEEKRRHFFAFLSNLVYLEVKNGEFVHFMNFEDFNLNEMNNLGMSNSAFLKNLTSLAPTASLTNLTGLGLRMGPIDNNLAPNPNPSLYTGITPPTSTGSGAAGQVQLPTSFTLTYPSLAKDLSLAPVMKTVEILAVSIKSPTQVNVTVHHLLPSTETLKVVAINLTTGQTIGSTQLSPVPTVSSPTNYTETVSVINTNQVINLNDQILCYVEGIEQPGPALKQSEIYIVKLDQTFTVVPVVPGFSPTISSLKKAAGNNWSLVATYASLNPANLVCTGISGTPYRFVLEIRTSPTGPMQDPVNAGIVLTSSAGSVTLNSARVVPGKMYYAVIRDWLPFYSTQGVTDPVPVGTIYPFVFPNLTLDEVIL